MKGIAFSSCPAAIYTMVAGMSHDIAFGMCGTAEYPTHAVWLTHYTIIWFSVKGLAIIVHT